MSDSGKLATKILIVLFVFPTFSWLVQFLVVSRMIWPRESEASERTNLVD